MPRQDIYTSGSGGVFKTGFLISRFTVDLPFTSQLCGVPIVEEKIVEMPPQTETMFRQWCY